MPSHLTGSERRHLAFALLISLLIHALLLSLTFSGQGLGLPGLGFPWRDRRIEVPELRLVLVPAQVTSPESPVASVGRPLQQATVEQPVAGGPVPNPSVPPAPPPRRAADAVAPKGRPAPMAMPKANVAPDAADANAPLRADGPDDTGAARIPEPPVVALEQSDEPTLVVPPAASAPMPI
ncbi:MAG: hypothetical protein ACM3N6_03330, partial [Betaproteobacteria bacterium]